MLLLVGRSGSRRQWNDAFAGQLGSVRAAAVRTAQAEYDQQQPDVVVGSSRGGAVAVNIKSKDTPLVLLCPAWKNWGTAKTIKPNSVILHSRQDDAIPFADSEELVANSSLPMDALIEISDDHRLADPEPLMAMREACERLGTRHTEYPNNKKTHDGNL